MAAHIGTIIVTNILCLWRTILYNICEIILQIVHKLKKK